VSKTAEGFTVTGGEGIGKVTKAGLDQPIGEWAINSVPRRMIAEQLALAAEKFDHRGGLCAEIFVPNGTEIAKKTYNPRMGIVGGISILGTSGIVEPMSTAALVETIRIEARSLRAAGKTVLPLTLGNFGERFVQDRLPFRSEDCVTCSNYIGEALDIALELGFESVLIVGHLGKLVKLGAGIMNTHSAHADGRMDVLITCGVLAGLPSGVLAPLIDCATVDAALDLLLKDRLGTVLEILVKRAEDYLNARVRGNIEVGAVMFSDKHEIILKTSLADELIKKITGEIKL
ncbi:MAG: cobalt-precorrin-5B (C(1))-methyltransferase CbiD, partial [Oscillospiraceae bacterium]|nr:cobalt-precorrin-5B (C(1))-methyltransferase CbiD [Oscillospiraceae bacterium]